jgi:hypothetical protein
MREIQICYDFLKKPINFTDIEFYFVFLLYNSEDILKKNV